MELRRILDGPLADWSEEHWKLFISRAAEYDEKAENEAEEARSAELDDIEDKIAESPARTLEGLLAKLRWLVDNMSEDATPDLPTLDTAYEWSGENRTDYIVARAWADAERLIGGGGKGGAA